MFGQAKQVGQLGKVTVRSHELGLVRHLIFLLDYNHCNVHSCTLSLRDQIYKPRVTNKLGGFVTNERLMHPYDRERQGLSEGREGQRLRFGWPFPEQ
jgi:hypothetical protein